MQFSTPSRSKRAIRASANFCERERPVSTRQRSQRASGEGEATYHSGGVLAHPLLVTQGIHPHAQQFLVELGVVTVREDLVVMEVLDPHDVSLIESALRPLQRVEQAAFGRFRGSPELLI